MLKNQIDTHEIKYLNMVPTDTRCKIYQIIYIGITAYNMIVNENKELQKSKFFSNINSRLLTFSIYRQFESDMLTKSFPLKVAIEKVNSFGYNSLLLRDSKVKISLAKTQNKISLPNKSRYRIKECKDNYRHEMQLSFDLDKLEKCKSDLIPAPTYIILGFKISNGQLEHLNFMVPDTRMDQAIVNLNLLDEYNNFIIGTKEESETEEQIATIKKEVERFIVNEG